MKVELIQGLLLAFAIVVILMPPYIRLLRSTGFTKQIRIEGPDSHQIKHGTRRWAGPAVDVIVTLPAPALAAEVASTPLQGRSRASPRSAPSTTT
jgi:UDP-N-acetylmuramyl pentapeptide phosphotransferase/UDP-N-acetylglucosamine-1-phosphate transferase